MKQESYFPGAGTAACLIWTAQHLRLQAVGRMMARPAGVSRAHPGTWEFSDVKGLGWGDDAVLPRSQRYPRGLMRAEAASQRRRRGKRGGSDATVA